MQFKLVAFGVALLVVGLVAYASIPTVHRSPISNVENVWTQSGFPVQPGTLVEQPWNITIFPGMNNQLQTNITVSAPEKATASVHFEILNMEPSRSCPPLAKSPGTVLVDQLISNQSTFKIPVNATGTYCFVFDNQSSQSMKSLDIATQIRGTGEQVLIARDGSANNAGLGLGALGLVVAIYGYSRKTVIPWE